MIIEDFIDGRGRCCVLISALVGNKWVNLYGRAATWAEAWHDLVRQIEDKNGVARVLRGLKAALEGKR